MPDLEHVNIPQPIEYGREARGLGRRIVYLIVGGIALLSAFPIFHAIMETAQATQLRCAYLQHQLMTFAASKEQVMY